MGVLKERTRREKYNCVIDQGEGVGKGKKKSTRTVGVQSIWPRCHRDEGLLWESRKPFDVCIVGDLAGTKGSLK